MDGEAEMSHRRLTGKTRILLIGFVSLLCVTAAAGKQGEKGLSGRPLFSALGKSKNGSPAYGCINREGQWVVPATYGLVGEFSQGLICVSTSEKFAYLDQDGKVAISARRGMGLPFSEGLAAVDDGSGAFGYIDRKGKWVIPPKFEMACIFSQGLAAVDVGKNRWGFIDHTGELIIAPDYAAASAFSEGRAAVAVAPGSIYKQSITIEQLLDDLGKLKWGFVDNKGQLVIPTKYSSVGSFSGGLAWVRLDGHFGYIDRTGKRVIPLKYNKAENLTDGLAPVEEGDKWGFINRKGKWIIKPKYVDAYSFTEGLACVVTWSKGPGLDDPKGIEFIDAKGHVAIRLGRGFTDARPFHQGLAAVTFKGHDAYINKKGKLVWLSPIDRKVRKPSSKSIHPTRTRS